MTLRTRGPLIGALAATVLIAASCGGRSSDRSRTSGSHATVVMARAPNSLDPAVGDTPEALEADWLAYTPLLTYAHTGGTPGTQLLPGLAQTLPSISDGGSVYTFSLIKGIRYSNGQPVRASDFTLAAERTIKLWPEAGRLVTGHIAGALAFALGRAKTISGISADNITGQITIRLTAPYGAFEDVLALPALAPVPAGTPFTDQRVSPPPGVGPYRIVDVVPGRSFALVRTPGWEGEGVQDVPAGHLDIDVRITGEAAADALSVLGNAADVFDSSDQIPPSVLAEVTRRASVRYVKRTMEATDLIFMDVTRKPFSSQLAREAVRAGLDQATISRIDSGLLARGCYVLPPSVSGHPQGPCPDGNRTGEGNLAQARALVKQSGMAGTRVVVATQAAGPAGSWMAYYASLLNQIGFRASLESGARARDPQTAFGRLDPALPNPAYFYDELAGGANPGKVDDPHINSTVQVLAVVPGSTLSGVAGFWRQLESYVADKAYVAVLGHQTFPQFVSSRIDFRAVVFSPFAGVDWSSLRLN